MRHRTQLLGKKRARSAPVQAVSPFDIPPAAVATPCDLPARTEYEKRRQHGHSPEATSPNMAAPPKATADPSLEHTSTSDTYLKTVTTPRASPARTDGEKCQQWPATPSPLMVARSSHQLGPAPPPIPIWPLMESPFGTHPGQRPPHHSSQPTSSQSQCPPGCWYAACPMSQQMPHPMPSPATHSNEWFKSRRVETETSWTKSQKSQRRQAQRKAQEERGEGRRWRRHGMAEGGKANNDAM